MPHPGHRFGTTLLCCAALFAASAARASDHLDAGQVRALVAGMPPGHAMLAGRDMSGCDLTGLDLSGADLSHAHLAHANLHGVKLVGANLSAADLTAADLTFTWIMRANFTGATLKGAILQTVVTSQGLANTPQEAAIFSHADLSDTSTTVHFSFDDLRGANFAHARMTVVMANQSMGLLRSEFDNANLDGADFTGAGLGRIPFRFAKLNGAVFRGADLTRADFTGAYLTGADFTGAKLDHANFEAATLTGVKGLERPQ